MLTVPNPIAHISSSVRTVEWPFPKYVSDVGACCRRQHSTSPAGPAEGPADLGVSRSCVVLDTTSIAWLPVGMCATGATRAGSPSQLCTRPLGGPRPPAPRRVRWWAFEKRCRGYLARRRASVGDESGDRITDSAFPSYLQSYQAFPECLELEEAIQDAVARKDLKDGKRVHGDVVWKAIRAEAERDASSEPLLSSFLYASILCHDNFERALAFVLSNRLADVTLLATELFEMFYEVLRQDESVPEAARADVVAAVERDPACQGYSQCLLYSKGFHAVQAHRISHVLWNSGSRFMALALQSRISEVFAVDIHPAARIGKGLLLDHATGVVIGETAVIGDFCSMLQGVTLGGTGKEHGDRHPKVGDGVLIGAYASILGNIQIGKGAQVAAGSLVLKPVLPHQMVAGSPAQVVGTVRGSPALRMQQWDKNLEHVLGFSKSVTDYEQALLSGARPPATAAALPSETSVFAASATIGEIAASAGSAGVEDGDLAAGTGAGVAVGSAEGSRAPEYFL